MKYNFVVKQMIDPKMLGDKALGLDVAVVSELRIQVDAKTELPDNLLAALKTRLGNIMSNKLGGNVEPTLISVEQ